MAKKKTSGRNPRSGNQQAASRPASAGGTKGTGAGPAPKVGAEAGSQPSPRTGAGTTTKPATSTKSATSNKPAAGAKQPASTKPAASAKRTTSTKPAAGTKPAASATRTAKPTPKPPATSKTGPSAKPVRPGLTRAERLAAAEQARHRRTVRVRAAIAGGVAVVLLVAGFLVVSNNRDRAKEAAGFEGGSCDFDRKSDGDAGLGHNHVANPTYKVDPPAGGDHNPSAAPAGIYTDANKPPDGQLVHSLEHGYVIIWYRPDLPPTDLTALQELTQRHARDVLLVPRPSLEPLVAATAWHARVLCGAPDVATLERFVDKYVNQGPEKIPH